MPNFSVAKSSVDLWEEIEKKSGNKSKNASRKRQTRTLKTYAAIGPPNFPAVGGGGLMTSPGIFRPLFGFS